MKELLLKMLAYAVEHKLDFNIEHDTKIFSTYDDTCGQRACYLEHFGYGGRPDTIHHPELFKVKRLLRFVNKEDEGKEDAVLLVLNLQFVEKITISSNSLKFNGLTMRFYNHINI